MRPVMGVFSSRVSYRAFSGPLLKHGRRLRPLSFPVNKTKGTEKSMAMIDVLKWDAAPRVFAYRYEDCQLNYKSQLIVTESQEAILVKEGLFYGPIGPGRHTLETKNFPFLTKMVSALTTNRKSPYTAEVWFLQKSVPLDMKWGTSDPILVEDPKYHIALPIRAFGQYGVRIADSCRFLARLMGRLPAFTEKTLSGYFKGVVITRAKDVIASVMGNENCSLLQIGSKLNDISTTLEKKISEDLADYGIELRLFMVNSISADDADPSVVQLKKALAKKAEMDIIGYSYVQERSFDALQTAAGNEGSAGALMGAGMGLGMGVGVGSPMGNAMAAIAKEINPSNTKYCINCGVAVPSEARFCPECGTKMV